MRRLLPGLLLVCAACAPTLRQAPLNSRPSVPQAWSTPPGALGAIAPDWWTQFEDPDLDRLIERALSNNTDLLTAVSRIEEARANVALARAAYLPMIDFSGTATNARSLSGSAPVVSTGFEPDVELTWQVDLFGRYRRLKRAAKFQEAASRADRDGVALSVASQVAQDYIGLASLDAELIVTRETVEARRKQYELNLDQQRTGYISQFEVTQAQSDYLSVLQSIPDLQLSIRRQELALNVLTGDAADTPILRGDVRRLITPTPPGALPSELLRRRPDIAGAELRVAAADATLASRRAEYLPNVQISADIGAMFIDALHYDPVEVWSIGGSVLQPIFEGGRLRAQVDVATAQRDQAAYAYRSTALTAFQDVDSALTGGLRYAEELTSVLQRRAVLVRSVDIAADRYKNGYSTFLDQLDAQRNLYSTQLSAISVHQSQLDNAVLLFVALGGGWTPHDGEAAARRPSS